MKVMLFRAAEMSLTSFAGYQWALAQLRHRLPDLVVVEVDVDAEPEQARFYGLAAGRLPALVYDRRASYASYIAVDDDLALHDVERWLCSLVGRPNADAEHYLGNVRQAGAAMLDAFTAMERVAPDAVVPHHPLIAELIASLTPPPT